MKRWSSPYSRIPCEHLRAIRLQPAVDVVEANAGDDAGRPVEDAREEPPDERVVPARLPARDEVEALVELREQLGDLGRVVLQVGVDRHDDVAASLEEAGLERSSLAEVPAEVDDDDVRHLVVQPGEDGHASVRRAVVDEDDLELVAPRLECRGDLGVQRLERVLLVEQGNDDRDHVT